MNRLTTWMLGRLPSRRRAAVVGDVGTGGFTLVRDGEVAPVSWNAIDRVVAAAADRFVGDALVLVIGLARDGVATVTDDDPRWDALVAGLELALPDAMPFAAWRVALLAGAARVEIYRRAGVARGAARRGG